MHNFDIPKFMEMGFQDPATSICEAIIDLHHSIFFFLIIISVLVIYIFLQLLKEWYYGNEYPQKNSIEKRKDYLLVNNLVHNSILEILWTITPSIILVMIAVPSFALLFATDELIDPAITAKVIGHQWYWSYEFGDYVKSLGKNIEFDSYMLPTSDLKMGDLRLLEVDNALILPYNTHIRFIITATDVLHSFAVPSLGIKVDAVPGRLNQIAVYIKRPGTFYGQCSELCGVNHAFMPICIKAVNIKEYIHIIKNY